MVSSAVFLIILSEESFEYRSPKSPSVRFISLPNKSEIIAIENSMRTYFQRRVKSLSSKETWRMISSIIILPTHRITTGVKAFKRRLKVFAKNNKGLLRYISLKNRGMVFKALKESLTLVFSSLSVMDFNTGLANI